eukprot:8552440-Alexandrium_andersonii.AAC.1
MPNGPHGPPRSSSSLRVATGLSSTHPPGGQSGHHSARAVRSGAGGHNPLPHQHNAPTRHKER